MAKACWIESCRDRAVEYCSHCSQDVCHYHFIEHKKWLRNGLLPIISQVNVMYNRSQRREMDQKMFTLASMSDARQQLDQWRSESVRHIDDVYDRTLHRVEMTLEEHKRDVLDQNRQNLDSLGRIRRQMGDLLHEGDVSYGQLQSIRHQLDDIERREQKLNSHPDIRVVSDRVDAERNVRVLQNPSEPFDQMYREKRMKLPVSVR